MSSFSAAAARVRDSRLPPRRRLLALRECVLHFAPYEFRATWHHLIVSARLPARLESDPDSLLRAVAEVEQARRLWLAEAQAYASRRQAEKAAGRRRPHPADGWCRRPQWLAFCPDPTVHPTEPLDTVVRRLVTAYRSGDVSADRCPVCETARRSMAPCPTCGVLSWNPSAYPWNPAAAKPPIPPGSGTPWNLIWHRLIPADTTVGGGDVTEFRAEYTPTSHDRRFGIFQLYVRGTPLGDATTTALYPHVGNLRALCGIAESAGTRRAGPLILGDTFDHLTLTLEATEQDLIFDFSTRPANEWAEPPPWAPPPERRMRLPVRRTAVVRAWQQAESAFRRILTAHETP